VCESADVRKQDNHLFMCDQEGGMGKLALDVDGNKG
jgi:hypothetical protein